MKLGMNFFAYRGLDDLDTIVRLMTENGFTATFTGFENPRLAEVLQAIKGTDIQADSLHAQFHKTAQYDCEINDIWFAGEKGDLMLRSLCDTADCCSTNEIPNMVVHLSGGSKPPRMTEIGYARFDKLMAYAAEKGVTVAYENQRMIGNLGYALEEYPDAVFCWDAGHEGCFTPGRRYMPMFGDRLGYLHLHDNFQEYNKDLHMLPGDGTLDYDYIAAEIAKTDYQGSVMLEVNNLGAPYVGMSPEDYYRRAGNAARAIRDKIEAKRQ